MKRIKFLLKALLSAIYPNKCICCKEIINEGKFLCDKCNNTIEKNDLNNFCLECGLETHECVCKFNVFRFNGLVCVFKNIGKARSAFYSYKFGKKQHYVDFFAKEMCAAVKKCYSDIDFNYICAVPSAQKFGYDHSGYIAKAISKMLNIPFADNLLYCNKKTKKQHKSTLKERMLNTEGKYSYNYRVDNATVLLIDDIKTTGATIDECTKMLLYAGASRIYCATALSTIINNKTKN